MTIVEIIVSLSKNHELSRLTEGLTMSEFAQLCDEMSAYIDAISQIPHSRGAFLQQAGDKSVNR